MQRYQKKHQIFKGYTSLVLSGVVNNH